MGQPSLDQEAWIIGADDASSANDPDSCTWYTPCGTTKSYYDGTVFMVRFTVSNSGNKTSGSVDWSLWIAPNDDSEDAAIAQVTGASATLQVADGSNLADADNTTSNQCSGTGTWQNGEYVELNSTVVPNYELAALDRDWETTSNT